MKKYVLFAFALMLSACGSGISGTYADSMGMTSLTFKSGHKVAMTTMGIETELNYYVEDDNVKIGSEKSSLVLTRLEDGTLQGPLGVKFTKKTD
jgi:hypothetical protein